MYSTICKSGNVPSSNRALLSCSKEKIFKGREEAEKRKELAKNTLFLGEAAFLA